MTKLVEDIMNYLENATQEELDENWERIKDLNDAGPTIDEYCEACAKSLWHYTNEETPKDNEQVYVMPQGCLMVWNEHFGSWDSEDGDDFCCHKEAVEMWYRIPAPPERNE